MRISTLKQEPKFFDLTIKTIEESFHYNDTESFLTDFYPLIGPHNHDQCYLLLDNDTFIGHVGVSSRELSLLQGSTPCSLYGGIVMAPEYRGKGLFTEFFHEILGHHQNSLFHILWSDQQQLYKKFGFHLAGGQRSVAIVEETIPNELQIVDKKLNELTEREKDAVQTMHSNVFCRRSNTLIRKETHWKAIYNMSSVSVRLIYKGERFLGYCFQHKGFDLQNVIHELVYLSSHEELILNALPSGLLWLKENSPILQEEGELHYSAHFKLGHPQLLGQFLDTISFGDLKLEEQGDEVIRISHKGQSFELTHQEFLTGLLGPSPIKEFENYLSPFIAGVDSI